MINDKAIIIKNISKIYYRKNTSKSGFFHKLNPNKNGEAFYALQDINLEIDKGQIVGIIGPNAAGKSTLLKIIAEVTPPSSGTVEIFGKVASILEIGIGFQPELSGYENIFLSGRLYGLSKKQISEKIDKITEMFGFPEFLHTKVKHYSSGMYMRLAFSVIINIEADIYLFDEVLSVGDAGFQYKAINEIKNLKQKGKTVLIVTHEPQNIMTVCNLAILLNKGSIIAFDSFNEIILRYYEMYQSISSISKSQYSLDSESLKLKKNIIIEKSSFYFNLDKLNITCENYKKLFCEQQINIHTKILFKNYQNKFYILFLFKNYQETVLSSIEFEINAEQKINGEEDIRFVIEPYSLRPNNYIMDVMFLSNDKTILEGYQNLISFEISSISDKFVNYGYFNLKYKILKS